MEANMLSTQTPSQKFPKEGTETIACEICLREIPPSVAQSGEGQEYVYYFCGDACYEQWLEQAPDSDIALRVAGTSLDYDTALAMARLLAHDVANHLTLAAWSDRARGRSMEPPAASQGAGTRININDGEYVFVFAPGG
jgi:hypothetical protein